MIGLTIFAAVVVGAFIIIGSAVGSRLYQTQ